MIDIATIRVLVKLCPNYHALKFGKGFARSTFSVIPCKDCRHCVTKEEADKRTARYCSRVIGLVTPNQSIVGEWCTCDKAQPKPCDYGELFNQPNNGYDLEDIF